MRVKVPTESVSDLLYNAEELYGGLLLAGLIVEASSVYEAVQDLRRRVREENEQ